MEYAEYLRASLDNWFTVLAMAEGFTCDEPRGKHSGEHSEDCDECDKANSTHDRIKRLKELAKDQIAATKQILYTLLKAT